MTTPLHAAALVVGVVVVLVTFSSIMRTLIVPRGLSSRLTAVVERLVRAPFFAIANRVASYEVKDRLLAFLAPSVLLTVLATWLALVILGFGLMVWAGGGATFAGALRESGSSVFTLGFAAPAGTGTTLVAMFAAASGLVIVALQIAYLPTLYGAFNRREQLVTKLQSRAGEPAWGPEILARHQLVGIVDNLAAFYDDWESWAADVAESHTNYPVLVHFRSPQPLRSWVVALLAVLDSAALYLSVAPNETPSEARLCLRMGFTCLRDIARVMGIPFNADPRPDDPLELTYDEFAAGIERIAQPGFPMSRRPEEAWPHFRGWRVNYESIAYAIADRVEAVPALWSGARAHPAEIIAPRRPVNRQPDRPNEDYNPPVVGRRQRRSPRRR
ncbi:MAG: hypothetical protein ABR520_05375 [Mycobacteriales bacterium]|nr:hypothetical protein [Frankia sp.]